MSAFSVVPEGTFGFIRRLNPAMNGWAIFKDKCEKRYAESTRNLT